jgi:hypothetical protein
MERGNGVSRSEVSTTVKPFNVPSNSHNGHNGKYVLDKDMISLCQGPKPAVSATLKVKTSSSFCSLVQTSPGLIQEMSPELNLSRRRLLEILTQGY